MDEQASLETLVYPIHTNTFAIPNDPALKVVYEVYKPSTQTVRLFSEQERTVYAEAFIENSNLGTLVDLCVRSLAHTFGPVPLPCVANDHLLRRVHFDALDVDLHLAKCYNISEERYWKRVVLARHPDKSLALKRVFDWKSLGITLKYVEIIEECPAEYWPEDEMKSLAEKVKDFITEMHIKRLQSLKERSFEKYFGSDSETSSDEDEDDSSDEDTDSTESKFVEEEALDESETPEVEKTESQLELELQMAKKEAQRKKVRLEVKAAKQKAREVKEAKRKLREARRAKREPLEEAPKKKRKKNPTSFFDIPLSESEDDGLDDILDKRNRELYLKHKKQYDYPAEHCHHIDLKFVQYFPNLQSFTIEFLGPLQTRNFHNRHMNFSQDDIKRLAIGLSNLPKLRIFRLRNSRMDAVKLITLCRTLTNIETLETVDFGYDQLGDDCASAFADLFEFTNSVRNLELESNQFGAIVLRQLGRSLQDYKSGQLEYLGLARNPINNEALHALISAIVGSKHISNLCLKGAKHLTETGLSCCIAQELLFKHPTLLQLDLSAVYISPFAADEILKGMLKNKNILEFKCYGSELDEDSEKDIYVAVKRNRYIADNTYLRESNMTTEEIEAWLQRTKNSIMLKVLAERETRAQCLANRPTEYVPSPASSKESLNLKSQIYDRQLPEYESLDSCFEPEQKAEPFIYEANEFDEIEFLEHVYQPGPPERYYYIQMLKQNYMVRENVKKMSLS